MKAVSQNSESGGSPRKAAGQESQSRTRSGGTAAKRAAQRSTAKTVVEEPFLTAEVPPQAVAESAAARREQPVHLEVILPGARKVCIAGNFNNWNCEADELVRLGGDKWVKDLTLPPGVYEYRLVADGTWMQDPNASRSVPNPFGELNSILVVAAAEAPA